MAKKDYTFELLNYGIYSEWNDTKKTIPKLKKYTKTIPVIEGLEFGYIIHFKKARGKVIDFTIKHPTIKNEQGKKLPDFCGQQMIKNNDYYFFLGDTFWLPLYDKIGTWQLITKIEKTIIADIEFNMVSDDDSEFDF